MIASHAICRPAIRQIIRALFQRADPKRTLTSVGETYQSKVAEALTVLRRGTADIRRMKTSPTLTVSVLPTFATKWLVPRLTEFERANPRIALRLAASYQVTDFTREPDIDVAIRLGRGSWPVPSSRRTIWMPAAWCDLSI